MEKDRVIGAGILVASVLVIAGYLYGLFIADEAIRVLLTRITVFIAVAGVMGILGWIGYTLMTTPPPKPIEEIEKELEEELKKLEEEVKEEESKEKEEKSKEAKEEKPVETSSESSEKKA